MIQTLEGKALEARIAETSKRLLDRRHSVQTEEAAKTSLVLPFLNHVLGYNVFDPEQVVPEYTADVGTKKNEKVDYALFLDGHLAMIVECKQPNSKLDNHYSQLFRYFAVTEAKIAVLTDGITYQFYTDIDAPNKLDKLPFYTVDMSSPASIDAGVLQHLTKDNHNIDSLRQGARDNQWTNAILSWLSKEAQHPSEDFIRFLMKQIYGGPPISSVSERFRTAIKQAFSEFSDQEPQENGDSPATETKKQQVYNIADELMTKLGRAPSRKEIREVFLTRGGEGRINQVHRQWIHERGIVSESASPAPRSKQRRGLPPQ